MERAQYTPALLGLGQPVRPTRRGRAWRILKMVSLGLVVSLAALTAAGVVYQAVASYADDTAFPAPGEMIDVGGYRLHIYCEGQSQPNQPTVILEAGGGIASPGWAWVQSAVAGTTRVCAYDRAGYGWSDPGPMPRDASRIAHELHALLEGAGVRGPVVLAGHSIGGLFARVYSGAYPDEVAGLVLVDSSHPDQLDRSPSLRAEQEGSQSVMRLAPILANLGIVRVTGMLAGLTEGLPERAEDEMAAFLATAQHLETMVGELDAFTASSEQTRGSRLENVPLIVLTAGTDTIEGWSELQEELSKLSAYGTRRVVEGAGHIELLTNETHANEVARAILEVIAMTSDV